MKINIIPSVIAIALAALLGYAVYSVAGDNPNNETAFAVSGSCFFICFLLGFGVSYEDSRKGVSLHVLSVISAIIMAISQFAFAYYGINFSPYIIANGVILLLYLLVFYGVYNSEQQ